MATRVPVAVFGAGWVSTERHVPALLRHGGFEVRVIVDRDEDRARRAGEKLGIPFERADRLSTLVEAGSIAAITCGTAPFTHHQIAADALEHGAHVLTEKPFTMTLDEGRALVHLAHERERVLAIVHNFQFAPSFMRVLSWLENGRLGTVRAIHAVQMSNPRRRLPTWFDELPLGLFYDESPHLLYLVRRLAGSELERLTVVAHPSTTGLRNTPAAINAHMRAADGVPVLLHMNFEAAVSEWCIVISGDGGTAICDVFRDIASFVPNDGAHRTLSVLRTSATLSASHLLGYARNGVPHLRRRLTYGNDVVFARYHDAITAGTRPLGIEASDALAVLDLQHWIVDAARGWLP